MPLDETSSTTSERARNAASASAETCVETAKPCPLVDQRAACPNGPKILRRGKPARELEGHLFANGLDLALDHLVMFAEPLDQFAHEQFGRRRARRDAERAAARTPAEVEIGRALEQDRGPEIGRGSGRERVGQYG